MMVDESMDDDALLVRLDQIFTNDDHARGCQGRAYACTCGYDERCEKAMIKAAARIRELLAQPRYQADFKAGIEAAAKVAETAWDNDAAAAYVARHIRAITTANARPLTMPQIDPADEALLARLEKALAFVQERDKPLPWVVHSGSSYRRIASETTRENFRSFPDGNVLHGIVDRHDGHHDLSMGEDQLNALVEIVNSAPMLIARIRELLAFASALSASFTPDEHRMILAGKIKASHPFAARRDLWHHVTFAPDIGLTPLGEAVREVLQG